MKQKFLDGDIYASFFPIGGDCGPMGREEYTARTLTCQFTEFESKIC